jgi:predicted metal-dependent hydrolase
MPHERRKSRSKGASKAQKAHEGLKHDQRAYKRTSGENTEVRRAQRIGVQAREVHIRPMKRKWASCSSNGRLTFDLGLLRQPSEIRAEVIVHELLHLKHPNHGRLFRALLKAYRLQPLEKD